MFGKSFKLFTLLGFEVSIDLTWLFLALLITWTLAEGYFPIQTPGLGVGAYWAMGLLGALGLFFSIIFHEFSHSLVARHYDLPISGITLFIFGGIAKMEDEPASPKAEFNMAVAGPLASLVLAGAFYLAFRTSLGMGIGQEVTSVLQYLALINFILAAFNLVPAFPLDGGRMLRAALWAKRRDLRSASRTAANFGSGFGMLLIILGVLSVITGNFIGGMWWFLIGLFIRGAATTSYQQTIIHQALVDRPVSDIMVRDVVTLSPGITLDDLIENYFYRSYHQIYPVVQFDRCVGAVTLKDLKTIHRDEWSRTPVSEVMRPCDDKTSVSPKMGALEALRKMRESGNSRLLVIEKETLVGILTMKDILSYLTFKMELEEGGSHQIPDPDRLPLPKS